MTAPLHVDARFLAAAGPDSSLPATGHREVAFCGRSNVGKSSLLNSLLGRRGLARTSKTPGATRTVNLFEVAVKDGPTLIVADLPGYGFAERSKAERAAWGKMLERYFKNRSELAAVVLLVDVRRGLEDDDLALRDFVAGLPRPLPMLVCATKLDKLPVSKRKPELVRLRKATGVPVIGYSAVSHEGRDALWRALLGVLDAAAAG